MSIAHPHDLVACTSPDEGNGVAAVSQLERHDACAVIDPSHLQGQDEVFLGDPDKIGEPGTLVRPRRAGAKRQ